MVENLNQGAVENWLVRMLGHARNLSIDVDWTFYCVFGQPGAMDDKARALRAHVIYSPVPILRKVEFIRALRSELRRGEYDVLHCHHDIVSAVYLLAGSGLPIHRRIAMPRHQPQLLTQLRRRRLGTDLQLPVLI